jgi:hypothetical protein
MIKRTYGKRGLPGSPARDVAPAASAASDESSLASSLTMVDDARKRRRDIINNGSGEREGHLVDDEEDDGLLVTAQPSVSAATLRAAGRARAMLEEFCYHLVRQK